jgi:hypothetical protein
MSAKLYRVAENVAPAKRVVAAPSLISNRNRVANHDWTRGDGEGAAREIIVSSDGMIEERSRIANEACGYEGYVWGQEDRFSACEEVGAEIAVGVAKDERRGKGYRHVS